MLSLNLLRGEYFTIGEGITVQVYPDGGRATVRVDAPRELKVLRGTLREQSGAAKPEAVARDEARGFEPKAKQIVQRLQAQRREEKRERHLSQKREAAQALETMERCLGDIEQPEVRRIFREQLRRILPLTE